MDRSISIIMPALNEEGCLQETATMVVGAATRQFDDYELIIFDDGSTDTTGEIADRLAAQNPNILVVHNETNQGIGACYQKGIELSTKEYLVYIPGDMSDICYRKDLESVFEPVGSADLVVGYLLFDARSFFRRNLSKAYVTILNLITGYRLKYYNGPNICRRRLVQGLDGRTTGYGAFAGTLIDLLRSGADYVEAGIPNRNLKDNSQALSVRSLLAVGSSIFKLARLTRTSSQVQPEAEWSEKPETMTTETVKAAS
ncbi:TPA: hypothetical protein DCE37_19650 [Candidatus Latescibacteria bacterium]|nr:hypothetical protein [Gemmatimonadota bacterium]HAA77333.1 hypothetical protein [Candidatus Latescibacterota bacterium]|tara:strand:+ start:496 stop:1266 length:771 start_codon:yes stop_codon:yes gene_type:complete